jgi:hypothetical protein
VAKKHSHANQSVLDATTASFSTADLADISSFGRSLIDDVDAAAARSTLGLGTAATVSDATLVHLTGAETITGAKIFAAGSFIDKGNQVYKAEGRALPPVPGPAGTSLRREEITTQPEAREE